MVMHDQCLVPRSSTIILEGKLVLPTDLEFFGHFEYV